MAGEARVRDRLVDALRAAGRVRTPAVEEALRAVPRHLFLPDLPVCEAYADEAVAVQHVGGVPTSSASQPSMMAIMLEQLDVRPGHRVLEIGAGTGYNAALLAHLVGPAGSVTAVDIDAELVASASDHLSTAGIEGVELHCADGALGYPPGAPYDRIVLTVGSLDIRPEWVVQLAPGGRLLLPLTLRGSQISVALDLGPDGVLRSRSVRSCAFIRLRGVAAGTDPAYPLPGTAIVLRPADPDPNVAPGPADLAAALAEPGAVVPAAAPLGAADLWDGFGLFLSLTTPGACRLLLCEPGGVPGFDPIAPDVGTLALAGPDGLAVLTRWARDRAGVRGYAPGATPQVERMLAALSAWAAAGRPNAASLALSVRPRSDRSAAPAGPGFATVLTSHCHITAGWPAGAAL